MHFSDSLGGGVGQVQRKETAEQGSKKEFPNFGNVQNLEILFCCRHYTRDVNQFVGGWSHRHIH